jgi:hypothetical protein
MDAMRDAAVSWKSTTSTVIQNCFGIEDATDIEEQDWDKSNQVEVSDQVDCPTSFEN